MALSPYSMQYLNQIGGLLTFVEISDSGSANAYKLVPVSHWHNGQQFPHDVINDLKSQDFSRLTEQGLEYYLVPESTTNAHGTVSAYVQVAQEAVPASRPRAAEPPPAVQKYLKSESRKIKRLG